YTYYLSVKAKDAAGNTSASSNSLTVKTTGGGSTVNYCFASCTSGSEHISNVSFGSINNASARDNYHDYTTISTSVNKGSNYLLTVTIGSVYSGDKVTAWIDWNGDGDFIDSGEKYSLSVSGSTATGNITVPATASVSSTRMRIRVFYYSASDEPCGDKQYGEVEDYTININSSASGNSYSSENTVLSSSDMRVYPNPSNGKFKLEIKNGYEGKIKVKVLDISRKS
ncbi:MAG: secretion protein, partial [Chloroflexia bacterium]|nr:secretion protein [Chloroflexia bacterium]